MKEKEDDTNLQKILIIIMIVIIITVFVVSLGRVNAGDAKIVPDEFKESKEEAKRKHDDAIKLLAGHEQLRNKLNKKSKGWYFFVRILFVLIWCWILITLYRFEFIKNLSDILSYTEAGILIFAILNFLTFGTIASFRDFIETIRIRIDNWIWRNHLDLNIQIENSRKEIKELEIKNIN